MTEIELLKVENGVLRRMHGLSEEEAGALIKGLSLIESLNSFLAQVAAEKKPLLTRIMAKTDGAEDTPVVSLWAAYGDRNPIDRLEVVVALLHELTDPDECRYDHRGYCQAHRLHERPCPHERAKELLARPQPASA